MHPHTSIRDNDVNGYRTCGCVSHVKGTDLQSYRKGDKDEIM